MMACGTDPTQPGGDDTTTAVSALNAEQPGVVEFMYRWYRKAPGVALAGYAAADYNGCGGSMIGPNIMMTAAHCGDRGGINFRTYPDGGAGGPNVFTISSYTCHWLVSSFADSDITLHFCDPGADGVSPGDRFGYLDMENRRPAVGDLVYSPWTNQQPSTNVPYALMYSPGKITRTNLSRDELWSVPSQAGAIGIESNVYAEAGASGSPQLSAITNKILVGPLSTAFPDGGQSRNAVSIYDYLYWGRADNASLPDVNDAVVRGFGLDPQNYYGWLDDELDWLFDIQTDIERLRGEAQRDWYALSFRSPRKNKLWDVVGGGSSASFSNNVAHVTRTDSGAGIVLHHTRLNLVSGGNYALSGLLRRTAGTGDIWVGLRSDAGGFSGTWLTTKSGVPFSIPVTATGPNTELLVWMSGNSSYDIQELTLARFENSRVKMTFDDGDQRSLWSDAGEFPGPATIIPDGYPPSADTPNWGLYVPASPGREFGAQIGRVPLQLGKTYQVCFEARSDSTALTSGHANILGDTAATPIPFTLTSGWATICSAFKAGGVVTAQFGLDSGSPYRVDNLRFVALP
jgi:hypothetical protein